MIFQGSFSSSQTKLKILFGKSMYVSFMRLYVCVCVCACVCASALWGGADVCVRHFEGGGHVRLQSHPVSIGLHRCSLTSADPGCSPVRRFCCGVQQLWGQKKSGEINLLWHIFINYVFVVNLFWVGSFCSDCKALMSLTSKAHFTQTGSKRFEMCLINPSSCWWTSKSDSKASSL